MNPNDDFDMDNMEEFLAEMDFLLNEDATATNTAITLDSSEPMRPPSGIIAYLSYIISVYKYFFRSLFIYRNL